MFGKKIEQMPSQEESKSKIEEQELTPEQETEVIQEQIQEMKEKLDDPRSVEAIQEEAENILSKLRKEGSTIKEDVVRWTVAVAAPIALFGGFALLSGDIKTPQREPGSKEVKQLNALAMARDGIQDKDEYKLIRDARNSMNGYVIAVGDNIAHARERAQKLNHAIDEYERTHPEEASE